MRKKSPYSELLWSAFFRIRTEYGECGKMRIRITPNTVSLNAAETAQKDLQNYKYQGNHCSFSKPPQASTNSMKNDYLKIARTFFTGRSIFSYLSRSTCYNFCTALTKSFKLHFLEIAFYSLKTDQSLHSYSNPVRNNGLWKSFKITFFSVFFFEKRKS